MSFVYSLVGADLLKKQLSAYAKDIQTRVKAEIEDTARNIESKAIRRAPAGEAGTILRQGISAKQINDQTWEVTSNAKYSAYVEFGTGVYAAGYVPSLPAEIQAYAKTFYVNGQGTLPATPFLFNSFMEERINLIKEIKKILNDRR